LNLQLIVPEITLVATAILVIFLDLAVRDKDWLHRLSLAGLVVAFGFALTMFGTGEKAASFGNMLVLDGFAAFFKLLFIATAFLVVMASRDYVARFARFQGEYHALILISAAGMMLMAATADLISLYIALELTSISLYALVGFLKDGRSTESALKYLLLGAIASAVLLYGMALVFGYTGRTQLGEIAAALQGMSLSNIWSSPALALGIVMLISGFGFKIAAVPFQMWVPDVYEGAPTPVTAYLSVASKAAGFAIILRVFFSAFSAPGWLSLDWGIVFAVLAAISMTVGNIAAIHQSNIKRLLGYSSIAQAGYLMVGLAAVGFAPTRDILGQSGVLFFLASYTVTNLGAFIAIIAISNRVKSDQIADYSGMGKISPLMALALTLCLISLIGMPPASGFMAKFYLFSGAVQHGLIWLVVIAVINSVISAYYYLRVVKVMWFGEKHSEGRVESSGWLRTALVLCCLGVLFMGIAPDMFMEVARFASAMFAF
jgi:NADH-quinone oxidoreductase subunit N